jgi:hypothetical protein
MSVMKTVKVEETGKKTYVVVKHSSEGIFFYTVLPLTSKKGFECSIT